MNAYVERCNKALGAALAASLFIGAGCGDDEGPGGGTGTTDASAGNGGTAGAGGAAPGAGGSSGGPTGGSAGGSVGGAAGTGGTTGASGNGGTPDSGIDESLRAPCTSHCEDVFDEMCPNDEGSMENCIYGCMLVGSDAECGASFSAWLDCALETPLACNDGGEARPQGCESEANALAACFDFDAG